MTGINLTEIAKKAGIEPKVFYLERIEQLRKRITDLDKEIEQCQKRIAEADRKIEEEVK